MCVYVLMNEVGSVHSPFRGAPNLFRIYAPLQRVANSRNECLADLFTCDKATRAFHRLFEVKMWPQ